MHVDLLHRAVPAGQTPEGLCALSKDRPIDSASVERYLRGEFGAGAAEARRAMERLARAMPPAALAVHAYYLDEQLRSAIPAGARGWPAAGNLELSLIEGPVPASGLVLP